MITSSTQRFLRYLWIFFFDLFKRKKTRKQAYGFIVFVILVLFMPYSAIIPVKGATTKNWNPKSFWFYPWGHSITHKGIDIFSPKGTPVLSSTHGIVFYTANSGKGGKSIMILGPRWRFHYYAHLDSIKVFQLQPLKRGQTIGTVGATGNAKGKPPHLHFAVTTPFPHLHLWDQKSVHGWKKIFYLDPVKTFTKSYDESL